MARVEDETEREWRTVPTDLAGWAMRAMQMKKERDALRKAVNLLFEAAEPGLVDARFPVEAARLRELL